MVLRPTEYTLPPDLVNFGHKCTDCRSSKVVYQITVPAPGFPCGIYCYKCLLKHCKASHRFPMPMETNLLDALQTDLGMLPIRHWHFMGVRPIGR